MEAVTLSEAKFMKAHTASITQVQSLASGSTSPIIRIKTNLTKRTGNLTKTKKIPNICIRIGKTFPTA